MKTLLFGLLSSIALAAHAEPQIAAARGGVVTEAQAGTSDAKTAARIIQDDRIAILAKERADAVARLSQEQNALAKAANKEEAQRSIERLEGDIKALDREIAHVSKQAPIQIRTGGPVATRTEAAKPITPDPSVAQTTFAYEGWDIFRNFGK